MSPAYFGKNAVAKKPYIGSFAVQLINGVIKIVIFLCLLLANKKASFFACKAPTVVRVDGDDPSSHPWEG